MLRSLMNRPDCLARCLESNRGYALIHSAALFTLLKYRIQEQLSGTNITWEYGAENEMNNI